MQLHDELSVIDLAALAQQASVRQPVWAAQSTDLNVNLLVWDAGSGVAEHVNAEVDVLLVGVAGTGVVEVDGSGHDLGAGQALIIPKGTRRAIRSGDGHFAYLTCHRRRAGLWPRNVARPPDAPAGG